MSWSLWVGLGAVFAGLGVAFGAFGAHALKGFGSPGDLLIFETAVRYQMYHSLALIGLGFVTAKRESPLLKVSGVLLVLGILIFSGSLYALVFTGIKSLGAVTPVGGLAFIVAWLLLAWVSLRSYVAGIGT